MRYGASTLGMRSGSRRKFHLGGRRLVTEDVHTVPTGGSQRQLTLPPIPESARQARRFVADVLADARLDDEVLYVATLLTSELVTNGIVHAHTELRVVVDVTERFVRVEVSSDERLARRPDQAPAHYAADSAYYLMQLNGEWVIVAWESCVT